MTDFGPNAASGGMLGEALTEGGFGSSLPNDPTFVWELAARLNLPPFQVAMMLINNPDALAEMLDMNKIAPPSDQTPDQSPEQAPAPAPPPELGPQPNEQETLIALAEKAAAAAANQPLDQTGAATPSAPVPQGASGIGAALSGVQMPPEPAFQQVPPVAPPRPSGSLQGGQLAQLLAQQLPARLSPQTTSLGSAVRRY